MNCIYLDHHATTPVDPGVFEEMRPFFCESFGNSSSSTHSYGWEAEEAVGIARKRVAELIGCQTKEVIFTSGATESINIALLGGLLENKPGSHMITTETEHKATLEVAKAAQEMGYEVTVLPVDQNGLVRMEDFTSAIKENTVLASVIYANNEIGSINPIREMAKVCREKQIYFHVDGAQAVGKFPVDVEDLQVDMMSISAHKIYGPKGVGALYIRAKNPRVKLKPIMFGASQEKGLSPGTVNVPGVIGLGKACEIASLQMEADSSRIRPLRDKMEEELKARIPGLVVNGHPEERLCGNLNVSIPDVFPDLMMARLQEVAVSSGSACSSASMAGSHVLKAIGVSGELSRSTLRFGIGRYTTEEQIDKALTIVLTAYEKSRKNREEKKERSAEANL